MTDRERLIDLIKQQRNICDNKNCGDCGYAKFGNYPDCQNKMLAHHLIENGVVVPPCKIGTIVYEIRAKGKGSPRCRFYNYSITTNCSLKNAIERGLSLCVEQKLFVKTDMARWGKTVFLTREEAERAMKREECQ